jgi:hypothetical protein
MEYVEGAAAKNIDASLFFPDDPEKLKFIDFAMEEFPAHW